MTLKPHKVPLADDLNTVETALEAAEASGLLVVQARLAFGRIEEQLEAAQEALRHSNAPGPYCKGGTLICEICVGSCGVEEHDELVEAVKALNPASEPPLYTDASLTATPLPPGADDGPSSPASRSDS
jgi:hypothetical protein